MRIVVFHNFYRSSRPSGENAAVLSDVGLLREAGHDVLLARKDSDDALSGGLLGAAAAAGSAVYSVPGRRDAAAALRSFAPHVAHVHNLYPLWSPSLLDAARAEGVPTMQVLHNYRLSCLSASHVLNGRPCFKCLGERVPLQGAQHRCYGGSAAGSAVMTLSRAVNNPRLLRTDHFLAVSEVVRRRAIEHGVDPDRITIKPEHLAARPVEVVDSVGDGFLSIGRLDVNKGPLLLVEAYAAYRAAGGGQPLRIAGGGPLEGELRRRAASVPGIELLGQVPHDAVAAEIRRARAVVSPALWEEPFGLTVLEAWREQRPVIVTDLGSPAEMTSAGTGWVVQPDPSALATAMHAADDADEAARRGRAGGEELVRRYSPQTTLRAYEQAWSLAGVSTA